jgi:hypothetical protein
MPENRRLEVGKTRPQAPNAASTIGQQPSGPSRNDQDSSKSSKDGWDKAAILANYLLVAIGILGVFYAARTLDKLERQTKGAENAAEAALRQVEVAVLKERARIAILFPEGSESMTIYPDKLDSLGSFRLNIKNMGSTQAFGIKAAYDAFACEARDDESVPDSAENLFQFDVPSYIEGNTWEESGPLKIDGRFVGSRGPELFYVYLRGWIRYNDVFKPERNVTRFLLRRGFKRMREGEAVSTTTTWEQTGDTEDNQTI